MVQNFNLLVQHWPLYVNIKAIFTLIPALLGLKGNLEMTLASRFSTQVNLGKIKDKPTILSAVLGNFALTQVNICFKKKKKLKFL